MGCGTATVAPPLELRPKLAGGSLRRNARTVTDERWQLAYTIYETAAALAEAERRQYVDTAAPDAEIAEKVLAMLDEMAADVFPEPTNSTDPSAAPPSQQPSEWHCARPLFVITGFVGQGRDGQSLFCPRPRTESRSCPESDRTKGRRFQFRKVHSRGKGRLGPKSSEHRNCIRGDSLWSGGGHRHGTDNRNLLAPFMR